MRCRATVERAIMDDERARVVSFLLHRAAGLKNAGNTSGSETLRVLAADISADKHRDRPGSRTAP